MFYLDLVEYEKTDSCCSEEENILRNPAAGAGGDVVERSSNQGNVKLAGNHLILFVENDWVVLGGEEDSGQQLETAGVEADAGGHPLGRGPPGQCWSSCRCGSFRCISQPFIL